MQKFDLLIVGAGMVGLTLALALRKHSDITVALVDSLAEQPLSDEPELRVSAINLASQQIFANLDVWPRIMQQRLQPYHHMHVWDKEGFGKLDLSEQDAQQSQLGWIIENKVIRNALWQQAQQQSGLQFFSEPLTSLGVGDSEVFASFASGAPICAKLVVGADGANSWVRQQLQMPMAFRDYDHHAIVATVACEQGHQQTAWQVFLPGGPLAFLPLYRDNLCSIVWSTAPDEAERLLALPAEQLAKELTAASDGKLGAISLQSERVSHPLTMRLAHDFVKDRVVLIGDAAHTIHPLAGQGVNLGLLDAAALAQTLMEQLEQRRDLAHPIALNAFSRWRRTDATEMIAAMEALKQVFALRPKPLQLLRGFGVSLLDQLPPVKRLMIRQALGLRDDLPNLAQVSDNLG